MARFQALARRDAFVVLFCLGMVLGCDSSTGIPPIGKIKEIVVRFARAGGEFIEERGGALSDVAEKAWQHFFPKVEDGVKVDPENELRGTLIGKYKARIVERSSDGETKVTLDWEFTNPTMIRDSVDDLWYPDPELYAGDLE